jgi:transcription elongation factor GreA
MQNETQYLSQEKFAELQDELNRLKTVERKEVAATLEYATSLGDLSENAEYQEARDRQASVEDRIKELEAMLKSAVIVSRKNSEVIDIGSVVSIKKDGGEEKTYTIVGGEEANAEAGKISHHSPIGGALLGHKKGDKVNVPTPRGEIVYTINKVA